MIAFDPIEASHARAREHGVEISSMERVMAEADVVVATTGRAGLIQPAMIRPGQVILALSNPDPEIAPEEAERAGAAFAGDGRSVNNVLGYPGIFRGALQAGAAGINVEMKLAAADAIADLAKDGELVPNALDQGVHDAVAAAVREAAERSGIARPERADQRPLSAASACCARSAANRLGCPTDGLQAARPGGTDRGPRRGLLGVSVFLAWYTLGDKFTVLGNCRGPNSSCSGWNSLMIIRFLLLVAAVAPAILAWIILRGHALSWPRGEMTAIIAIWALGVHAVPRADRQAGDAVRRDQHQHRLVDRLWSAGC